MLRIRKMLLSSCCYGACNKHYKHFPLFECMECGKYCHVIKTMMMCKICGEVTEKNSYSQILCGKESCFRTLAVRKTVQWRTVNPERVKANVLEQNQVLKDRRRTTIGKCSDCGKMYNSFFRKVRCKDCQTERTRQKGLATNSIYQAGEGKEKHRYYSREYARKKAALKRLK